jgi:HemY protein
MGRALVYLALLALGVAGVLWFVRLGGAVEIRVSEYEIVIPFALALLALALLFTVLHLILAGIAALRRWPARRRAKREARRRNEGDLAVTRALVALSAGAPEAARLEVRRARERLGETPQVLLLSAQAERLAGREEAAAQAYLALASRDDSRFLGLRGLLRQAIAREDWPTAQRLAREAEAAQPGAAWLRQERETLALRTQDWREALALAAPGATQAPLALAAASQEADPNRAAELEKRAYSLDPSFVPATLAFAGRLKAAGNARRARQVLEEGWRARPHPDIAEAYLADEPDPEARLKAADQLTAGNPAHPESRLVIGRAATAAGMIGRARQELETLAGSGQTDRRAYLALSDLEEAERGDQPEARAAQSRWLRQAATAAPEPRWRCTACGNDHAAWTPTCPHCQAVGSITWTSPQTVPVAS